MALATHPWSVCHPDAGVVFAARPPHGRPWMGSEPCPVESGSQVPSVGALLSVGTVRPGVVGDMSWGSTAAWHPDPSDGQVCAAHAASCLTQYTWCPCRVWSVTRSVSVVGPWCRACAQVILSTVSLHSHGVLSERSVHVIVNRGPTVTVPGSAGAGWGGGGGPGPGPLHAHGGNTTWGQEGPEPKAGARGPQARWRWSRGA